MDADSLERLKQMDASLRDRVALVRELERHGLNYNETMIQIFGMTGAEFNNWHSRVWPACKLGECRGPHVLTLLRMKAIQLGWGK